MDIEEFIYVRYKDNVIIIREFRKLLDKSYHIVGDRATSLINKILDYQRRSYGDALDCNIAIGHNREELIKMSVRARQRRKYRERRYI